MAFNTSNIYYRIGSIYENIHIYFWPLNEYLSEYRLKTKLHIQPLKNGKVIEYDKCVVKGMEFTIYNYNYGCNELHRSTFYIIENCFGPDLYKKTIYENGTLFFITSLSAIKGMKNLKLINRQGLPTLSIYVKEIFVIYIIIDPKHSSHYKYDPNNNCVICQALKACISIHPILKFTLTPILWILCIMIGMVVIIGSNESV